LFTFAIVSKFQEGVAGLWKDIVNVDLLPWVHKNNEKLPVGEDRRLIRKAPRTSLLLRKPALPAAEVGKSSVATVNIWRKLVVKVDRISDGERPQGVTLRRQTATVDRATAK
jgi:hypothetical protein